MKSFEYDLNNIEKAATWLLENCTHKILLLNAEMGSGKTTLTKELIKTLGSQEIVSSPTFSLVNEYQVNDGILYHFDLYRLDSAQELFDIGFEEYIDSDSYVIVEWPEKAKLFLDNNYHEVVIEPIDFQTRKLIIKA